MDDHVYPNEEAVRRGGRRRAAPATRRCSTSSRPPHASAACGTCSCRTSRPDAPGTKLSNLDYAPVSEQLGKVEFASELLNCSAPDTGNMEILNLYGSDRVKQQWLAPLLEGEIRSGFSMTEPDVASSDAANIGLRIERRGDTLRPQRHEVVHVRGPARPVQGADRDGQVQSRRPEAPAAVDARRAQGQRPA